MFTVAVESVERPKGRPTLWACSVSENDRMAFSSRSVSLRLLDESAAHWLGQLVADVLAVGSLQLMGKEGPPQWQGNPKDDCSLAFENHAAHAEWLSGPSRGGVWYCAVYCTDGSRLFHTADFHQIQPKSGRAARWLCELVIQGGRAGIVSGYPD